MKRQLNSFFQSHVFSFIGTGGGMGAAYFHGSPGSAGASSPVSSYASYVLFLEPALYWPMNEPSAATSAVEVVLGYNASVLAQASAGYSVLVSTTGDTSWNFDGINDALKIEEGRIGRNLNGADAVTLLMWLELDLLNTNDSPFVTYIGHDSVSRFGLSFDCQSTNVLRFGARSRTADGLQTIQHTTSTGERNAPLMVVGIANYATDRMAMFFNAEKVVASTAVTFGSSVYSYASAGLVTDDYIGAQPNSSRWMNGRAGHVALFTRALTSTEVRNLYYYGVDGFHYAYTSAVIADSPEWYWRLDEGSPASAAADYTGKADGQYINTPTKVSALVSAPFRIVGDAAYRFSNASSTYVSTTASGILGSNARAMECIFSCTTSTASDGPLMMWGTAAARARNLLYVRSNGKIQFDIGSGYFKRWAGVVNDGGKYHIVCQVSSGANISTARLFIDGVSATVSTNGTSGTLNTGTTYDVHIGSDAAASWYLNGTIDEVAIYATTLTEARISKHAGKS